MKELSNKNYEIKNYEELLTADSKLNELLQEYIVKECLNIANEAQFPTDYTDVKEHLFEKEEYLKLFIIERDNQIKPTIKGFAVCDSFYGYNNMKFLHCHGIILSPQIQGKGFSKELVNHAVELTKPDVLTAKTHNPRCFNSFININGVKEYYPNGYENIPSEIIDLYKTDPFISVSDENLIYKDAYPDVKVQQSKRNSSIDNVFNLLEPYDAQSVIVIINDEKLNKVKTNVKSKVLKYEHN